MHSKSIKIFMTVALSLILLAGLNSIAFSGKIAGDDGIVRSINHPEFDVRLDILSATGPIAGTISEDEDTITIPVMMTGTNTETHSGLSYTEFSNVIYFDATQLEYIDFTSENWDMERFDVSVEYDNGDIYRIEIHAWDDQLDCSPHQWLEAYSLRFFIKCLDQDEQSLPLTMDSNSAENWVKVLGLGSLEEYDFLLPGSVEIMAYKASLEVDSVMTYLGLDTVEVPVYVDSINYAFCGLKNYFSYDLEHYQFVRAEAGPVTELWDYLTWTTSDNMVCISAGMADGSNHPLTSRDELYKLIFTSSAVVDNIVSPIEFIDNPDSNYIMPLPVCQDFLGSIDYITDDGKIVIPDYRAYAKLEFLGDVVPGEQVHAALRVRQNFPAGKYPHGDIKFLVRHDPRLIYQNTVNINNQVDVAVTSLPPDKISISLNSPYQTPGFLPPSNQYVTYCEFVFEVDENAGYSCPDSLVARFLASFGQSYGTRMVDTTGQVECNMTNGGLYAYSDAMQIFGAHFYCDKAKGEGTVTQHFYIDHNFVLDSFSVLLDYNDELFCVILDQGIPGSFDHSQNVHITEVDNNTLLLSGSGLKWGPLHGYQFAEITWGAKSAPVSMLVDLYGSEAYDRSLTRFNSVENDNYVTITSLFSYPSPYPVPGPCDDGKSLKAEANLPMQFKLNQNIPNPFNPTTVISFDLPQSCEVSLEIFNVLGQRVESLINDHLEAGTYEVPWNSRTSNVSSGVYFYILKAGSYTESKKMLLLK